MPFPLLPFLVGAAVGAGVYHLLRGRSDIHEHDTVEHRAHVVAKPAQAAEEGKKETVETVTEGAKSDD
jgi:hypothetical protein